MEDLETQIQRIATNRDLLGDTPDKVWNGQAHDQLVSEIKALVDQIRREAVEGLLETIRTNAPDFYRNYVDYLLEHKGIYLKQQGSSSEKDV